MPARPPPRTAPRPASFKPPVHHAAPPARPITRPPPITPPVHRPLPPTPPVHRPDPPPAQKPRPTINPVVPIIMNQLLQNQSSQQRRLHDENASVDKPYHDQDIPTDEGRRVERANEQSKGETPTLDEIVKQNDRMFEQWEAGSKTADAKMDGVNYPPQVPSDFKVENVYAVNPVTYKPDRVSVHQEKTRLYQEKPFPRPTSYNRQYTPKRYTKKLFVAAIVVAVIIPFCFFGLKWNSLAPAPSTYHEGPFQADSIHVVDGNNGTDVSDHVSFFEAYLCNDTADYGSYLFIGNASTLTNLGVVLNNIEYGIYYLDVVVYTAGIAPYGDSWDYLTTGDNYIYLYPS